MKRTLRLSAALAGILPTGKHSFTISPAIPDGIYVLHVTAGKHHFQTIIVKKKGIR